MIRRVCPIPTSAAFAARVRSPRLHSKAPTTAAPARDASADSRASRSARVSGVNLKKSGNTRIGASHVMATEAPDTIAAAGSHHHRTDQAMLAETTATAARASARPMAPPFA
jgi:hypothetical protein